MDGRVKHIWKEFWAMKTGVFTRIRYFFLFIVGVFIGALFLWGICARQNQAGAQETESNLLENKDAGLSENQGVAVDYPFSGKEEGWSLILRGGSENAKDREAADKESAERNFCLYDESGQLLQQFPCGVASAEVTFRYDVLFAYYKDLIVYPADAQETGAEGLCYQWESEKQRFVADPVVIPWYQEGSVREEAFLVCGAEDGTEETVETKSICRIHQELRRVIELRRWTVRKDAVTEQESLCIRDCLEEQDIYTGNVERCETVGLRNEKYYQYLLWEGLKRFGSAEDGNPIRMVKDHLEQAEYEDKQAFLADYGFAGTKPFYEYCDRFGNLLMELYFDPQAGRGCGIRYYDYYDENLEKRAGRDGFAFEEMETDVWKPQDTFSTRAISGKNTREQHWPLEIYEYTEDDKLSSFEAKTTDLVDGAPMEVSLLSLDYIYRDDGTLYHKEYYHYPKFYGTTGYTQSGDYDEQGRLAYKYSYITHGAIDEYYLYEGNSMEPAYCLLLDWGGGGVCVRMSAYHSNEQS